MLKAFYKSFFYSFYSKHSKCTDTYKKIDEAALLGSASFFINFYLVPSPNSFINSSKLSLETIGWANF